jgi:hypothetical protein
MEGLVMAALLSRFAAPPFTAEQFLDVFRRYNEAVWPAQIVLLTLAFFALGLVFTSARRGARGLGVTLGVLWLWTGAAYHLAFFAAINPVAVVFGAFFMLQGALFVAWGSGHPRLRLAPRTDAAGMTGAAFIVYALVLYPLLGYALGHRFPEAPTFGLPCPTTIFTFGILLWSGAPVPLRLVIIPALWSVLGLSAALEFGIVEDVGLVVAGVAGTALIVARNVMNRRVRPSLAGADT